MRHSLPEPHRSPVGLHDLPHQFEAQAVLAALGAGDIRLPVQRLQPGGIDLDGAPAAAPAGAKRYAPGDVVMHKVFGRGVVTRVTPAAGDLIVEIRFDKVGVKKTMANFAPLTKVSEGEA